MTPWVRIGEQAIAGLCALGPAEAAGALRELLAGQAAGVRCRDCQTAYEVRGETDGLPVEPCPACGGVLEPVP